MRVIASNEVKGDMKETVRTIWGEALMISVSLMGHIRPMVHVAKLLMERGFSVTVIVSEDMQEVMRKQFDDSSLDLDRLLSLQLVQPLDSVEDYQPQMTGIVTNLEQACRPFFRNLQAELETGSVRCPKVMIADMFLGWTQEWADWCHIPRYVLYPSPAAAAATMMYHEVIKDQLDNAVDQNNNNLVIDFPLLPFELQKGDVPDSLRRQSSFRTKITAICGESMKKAAGILFNSVYELEQDAFKNMEAMLTSIHRSGKVGKMLPIGPMLPPEFFKENTFVAEKGCDSPTIKWLDKRPESSVLYIAFGSWCNLSKHQTTELANALEACQVPFLWILRTESSGNISELVPEGFQERTKDFGFIYSEFAPQLQILSHPATGGFLTHCGWNSCLESLSRGIPMVAWPLMAEQGICSRILIESLRVATEAKRGHDDFDDSVDGKQIERAIRTLMKEPSGNEMKQRAIELQLVVRQAVSSGGSSQKNFEILVQDILAAGK